MQLLRQIRNIWTRQDDEPKLTTSSRTNPQQIRLLGFEFQAEVSNDRTLVSLRRQPRTRQHERIDGAVTVQLVDQPEVETVVRETATSGAVEDGREGGETD